MNDPPASNLDSPSPAALRRSGAVRKLPPLPRRLNTSGCGESLGNTEHPNMDRSPEYKPIQRRATDGDISRRDWHHGHRNQAQFLSTLIAAMTELQAEQAGKAVSESKNASLYQDATAGEPDWRDTLVWDLNGVLHLRRLLVLWAECKVPASDIGLFLVKVLYERDEHLGNRLTRMVNLDESYSNVALGIMKHYQIRDSDDQPMWMTLDLGEVDLRPSGNSSAGSSRSISVPTLTTGYTGSETTRQSFHTASTSSVDLPPRWPFYMSGADLEDFFLNNGPETSDDELSRRAPDKVVSLRSPSSITKLQVVMASSNPVPEPIAGDMIDPDQSYSTSSVGIDALQTQDVFHPGLTSARTGQPSPKDREISLSL